MLLKGHWFSVRLWPPDMEENNVPLNGSPATNRNNNVVVGSALYVDV